MSTIEEYLTKSLEELETIQEKLTDELEEIEEERMFMLGQTGVHLPGATVKKYEAEIDSLKERLNNCNAAIEQKKT